MQNSPGKKYVKSILNARYGRIGRPGPAELRKMALCVVEPMTKKQRDSWVHNIGKILRHQWQFHWAGQKPDLGELQLNVLLDKMEGELLAQLADVYELRRRLML